MSTKASPSDGGMVKALAYRQHRRDPMVVVDAFEVVAGEGVVDEDRPQSHRQITLLSTEAWSDVCVELGAELPWHLRRANVLTQGIELSALIGRTLQIGDTKLVVHGETRPCDLMDYQKRGLKQILKPNGRGGVFAEVTLGGPIAVGATITLLKD